MRGISYRSIAYAVIPLLLLSGCSYFFPEKESSRSLRQQLDLPGIKYTVDFNIVGDKNYETLIIESTQLHRGKERPPISTNALRFRTREDLKRIKRTLKNKGFYDARVTATIRRKANIKAVTIDVDMGERYTVAGIKLLVMDAGKIVNFPPEKIDKAINVEIDDPLDQDKVFDSVIRLTQVFKNQGYPFVQIDEPTGVLDHKTKKVNLDFKVNLNGKRYYGPVKVSGFSKISETYIRNRIAWQKGDLFDARDIEKTKRKLIDTEIFSTIQITPQDVGVEAPIIIEVTEGPARAIGVGAKFDTSEGVGGKLYWEHKNLFGNGERFSAKIDGSQIDVETVVSLEIPDVFYKNNSLVLRVNGSYEDTKAYRGTVYNLYGGFKHRWSDEISYSYGVEYESSRLKDFDYTTKNYTGFPLTLVLDYANDLINPIKGWRLKGEVTPYFGNLGRDNKMLKTVLSGSYYLRLIKRETFVTAFWTRLGQLRNIDEADIPLNKRFYSGGGGSVRGYGYQKLGPINAHGTPSGGQSLVEFGIEPRLKISEKIGVAAFVEAGTVSTTLKPQFNKESLLVGLGIGGRYYTDIGPIRLDLAMPTKRRKVDGKRYDSAVQVYISIGQSF